MHLRRPVLGALLVLLATTGCDGGTDAAAFDSSVTPVDLEYDAPTYAARTADGLLVRSGRTTSIQRGIEAATWLPNGHAILQGRADAPLLGLFDPKAVRVLGSYPYYELPSRSVTQINTMVSADGGTGIAPYDLSLAELETRPLPKTDNPDATDFNELERNYYGAMPTIDGATFVLWHDSSEWYEDGDYGLLRLEGDRHANASINERLVALYLSADGASLLALRQRRGDPCGGCEVRQEIVELDPETGKIAAEYGMPEDYDKTWGVEAVDKVGDRVAVRFDKRDYVEDQAMPRPAGTWVYDDGDWSLVAGSKKELTWWQGPDDRIVARLDLSEKPTQDRFQLLWVHGDEETPLPGDLGPANDSRQAKLVPGQLLPPE